MVIRDVLFMKKIIRAADGILFSLRTLSSAQFMMIVSICLLEFLDLLIFFLLVITELRCALS